MTALLRTDASPALVSALASGEQLWKADMFVVTLVGGAVYRWTSWDRDLSFGGHVYSSKAPWISQQGWKIGNTMEVTNLKVQLQSLNEGFAGAASIKAQMNEGLFDWALLAFSRVYMRTPGDADELGGLALFTGHVGALDQDGVTANLTVRARTNELDQYVPRNLYQVPCNHAFCDAGCTLLRATYTTSYAVGGAPTTTFVPWASAPSNPGRYKGGTLVMTGGALAGSRRAIAAADSSGLTLVYPLLAAPALADTFDAFEGCDKSFNSGSVQSCTARSNTAHYRGFEFVPPPNASY